MCPFTAALQSWSETLNQTQMHFYMSVYLYVIKTKVKATKHVTNLTLKLRNQLHKTKCQKPCGVIREWIQVAESETSYLATNCPLNFHQQWHRPGWNYLSLVTFYLRNRLHLLQPSAALKYSHVCLWVATSTLYMYIYIYAIGLIHYM